MEIVEFHGIEQHVILHGRSAKSGIVRDSGNAAVRAFGDPRLDGVQLLRAAVGALQNVAIDKTAGAEERSHTGRYPGGKRSIGDALKNLLAREIGIRIVFESEDYNGKPVEGNGAHYLELRRPVHGQFERQGGEPLHFFRGMAPPLRNQFDDGRRQIRIGVHRHALKRHGAGDHDQYGEKQHHEALLERELYDAMDYECLPVSISSLSAATANPTYRKGSV